jgi:ABC-type multidrug transport system fused ATPase/permease subunit
VVCFNIVLAFTIKDVLDAAIRGEQALLARALAMAAGTLLVGLPVTAGCFYVATRCSIKTMTEVRMRLFDHLVGLPVSRFERQHGGDLVSRCTNDVKAMGEIYGQSWSRVFSVAIGLIAMTSIFLLDWRIGLLVLLIEVITAVVNTCFADPLRRTSETIQERMGALTERLTDLLQGLPVTKMFHLEEAIHRLYVQENAEMSAAMIAYARTDALFKMSDALLSRLKKIGLLALGLFLVVKGHMAAGTIVAIVHLQGNASVMFGGIAQFVNEVQRSLAGASRVFELLDSPPEPERYAQATHERHQAAVTGSTEPMVEIRNLDFCYEEQGPDPTTGTPILRGIDLSVAQGQVAALVGPSGAGKSTIVKLLLGFYPPDDGTILVDGKPMDAYSLSELRTTMAYVPQGAYLFDGTIEENIYYGRPGATKKEIVWAARMANAHEFILEQPDGYATVVGERGAKLSGGQRQRIAIARALLKDAPILLLDEATSALDSESEQLVQDALSVLMEGRTTIVIAHRLSTIEKADTIYAIDDGRIVERARHDELVARGGLYASLYELQSPDHTLLIPCG